MVQRLYLYLHFTAELEQAAINPVTQLISRRRLGMGLPDPMIADAFKIYTDEAWHAQFSHDMIVQVAVETGLEPVLPEVPQFLRRLEDLRTTVPTEMAGLADLLFAIVSETLISAILRDIPRDDRVHSAVRQLVHDHAGDEARHSAFFGTLLIHVWPSLSRTEQSKVGPLVPQFIRAFLEPDRMGTACALASTGFAGHEIDEIITASYPASQVSADIRAAASGSVRRFEAVGVLDDPRTREAFEEHDLVGGAAEATTADVSPSSANQLDME
jgi:hypothetical protein